MVQEFGAKYCETLLDVLNPAIVESAIAELKVIHPYIPSKMPLPEPNKDESDSADDENVGADKVKKKKKGRKGDLMESRTSVNSSFIINILVSCKSQSKEKSWTEQDRHCND